jgi:hypothetical protein
MAPAGDGQALRGAMFTTSWPAGGGEGVGRWGASIPGAPTDSARSDPRRDVESHTCAHKPSAAAGACNHADGPLERSGEVNAAGGACHRCGERVRPWAPGQSIPPSTLLRWPRSTARHLLRPHRRVLCTHVEDEDSRERGRSERQEQPERECHPPHHFTSCHGDATSLTGAESVRPPAVPESVYSPGDRAVAARG